MKVLFDTNIYICWIREKKYSEFLLDIHTQKYLSSYVLLELWAGVKTKQATRIIDKLQKPYIQSARVVTLTIDHYITAGQILADLSESMKGVLKNAGFVNDLFIALSAVSIGATLITANKKDFEIIGQTIPGIKIKFV